MAALMNLGQIIAVLLNVLGACWLVMEFSGHTFSLSHPFFRSNGFTWSATAVATAGVLAAVFAVGLATLGNLIVVIPGFVSINPTRGLECVYGLLFGLPGVAAGMISNPMGDILTGKLSLGSFAGTISTGLTSYLFYRMFRDNPGLTRLGTPAVAGRFAVGILVMAVVLKGMGIAGFLAAVGALPQHVAWYVAFPSIILGEGLSNAVVGPLLTKILYPFVDRMGLTPNPVRPIGGISSLSPASLHD